MIFLVRHAEPAVDPDHQPHEWQLSEAGRRSARSLGRVLPTDAVLVASPEPKARQTLEPLGRVLDDQRFREVVRDEPFHRDFRARRLDYIAGTDHPAWEPREQVVARFDHAVRFWSAVAGRPVVVATHGMAMTLWLSTVG